MNIGTSSKIRKRIEVKGIVQGVGFRPFVYKLAKELNLCGFVLNNNEGVLIEIEGFDSNVEKFCIKLESANPPLSDIKEIHKSSIPIEDSINFEIKHSTSQTGNKTFISPDMSICEDCRNELLDPNDRRYLYPFINCTNCGPRFTIIKYIPYDRKYTTMESFEMCGRCKSEYNDPLDRRFHAQPNACLDCGPQVWLEIDDVKKFEQIEAIEKTIQLLKEGKIVAIKGLGGYHLAVDALNTDAVKRLRDRKNREAKPLAVMADSISTIEKFAELNDTEGNLITSYEKPIVLLKKKKSIISELVAPGNQRIGVILPYTPLHIVLLEKLKAASSDIPVLVMTSANLSEEPIAIDEDDARSRLSGIADAFLMHNREILIRADDSVAFVINEKERIIRRSRGYVPKTFSLLKAGPSILALGAELKNTIAISKNENVFISQHIGDLTNLLAYEYFKETISHLQKIMNVKADYYACDLHPDYLSTKWAVESNGLKRFIVQHHHAHMASCMLENKINEKVIGVILDGTGLGYNNTIWGGEILIGDYTGFERFAHLEQIPLPGGDVAAKEPWRIAVSYLNYAFDEDLPYLRSFEEYPVKSVIEMIKKNINSPLTSSTGRLFDAVSAMAGGPHKIRYEAEAAIHLTQAVEKINGELYDHDKIDIEKGVISLKKFLRSICKDVKLKRSFQEIAERFHSTFAEILVSAVSEAANYNGITKVVLSGGSFQNEILLTLLENKLSVAGFEVFSHSRIPTNDGGISFGQIAIASKLLDENLSSPVYKSKGEMQCA